MSWDAKEISLDDQSRFETLNGLWAGKTPPFVTAGVIRNTNFTESGRVDYSDVAWLQVEQKQLAKRQLTPGDIIIERSGGGPKQPVGRVVYFAREDGPFSFSNFTSAIRVRDTEAFDPRFVFYRLLELYQSGRTEDIQRRTTGIRNLDFTAYKERARFPEIPLPEQQKIAGVLDVVQQTTEQQERLLATTAELKRALLHRLFTQGVHGEPQKETEIGLVPKSWDVRPLDEYLSEAQYGLSEKGALSGPYALLRMTNQQRGRISPEKLQFVELSGQQFEKFRVEKHDILFNRTNSHELVGRTAIFDLDGYFVFASYLIRLRTKAGHLRPHFLNHYFNWDETQIRLKSIAARAVSQSNISATRLRGFLVPVPKPNEQDEIISQIDCLEAKTELHSKKGELLEDLFRTLLHDLMTGRIRVRDLDLSQVEAAAAE
jgi:type I restriction enzyme S subunit